MNDKYIVYFISKTKKKMQKFIEMQLKENQIDDLVPSYGNIFTALYEHGGRLKMSELSSLVNKDKSTITVLVNKLIERKYIQKEFSKEDRRVVYIVLTEKGRAFESVYKEISAEINAVAFEGFEEGEKEVFLKLLKRMNNNFGRHIE
ncbi:MarR family winged helix-turn-helix transcriptional regulator [Fusibacter ferrireducens]|uniref:HTH-type transcriptional regulator SarZ n=1 Tax=Fusibacter ferrireducens TaxID=2785058 RepID=A0ABR9ZSX9_9FIRM|nr:MarR family transcriptional regulator [Fusibacter ferrireducens]MBF4693580.1 MarR family transcriptional regulator [Fusibacter ferrireducens]